MNFVITKISTEINSLKDELLLQRHSSLKTEKHRFKFRMFDDDGDFYYEGLSQFNFSFEPLDDFGRNSGCTEIHFLEHNQFVRL